ncbi:DUF488 domain-containing protein [Prosthecobacter sp.]|uniref:DUF488 domain-containing protein n=1 Tax=Prosthecobacter sp. TaxID=1965333 RepID=UPI002486D697|nr:DUF488 domain-containing protein [Prosthecobacter sp.]MDI1314742.1 DUF488 domain-containing protein [Prosthecobacter sp.]
MLFERQRVLLTLLDALGGQNAPTDFQKLLFLYTREEANPSYEFVPYRFGCFSFTSYADKRRLIEQGLLVDDAQQWLMTDAGREIARKRAVMPLLAGRFNREHAGLRGDALVAEVYRRHPYYATRSEIVDKVLTNPADRARVEQAKPQPAAAGLLTIGYEGKCLETYLNQLIRAGVTMLCDVRRNPLSRKYGFSKRTLSHSCESVGIRYEHLPQLGVASEERRELNTQADYDALFADYERKSLPQQTEALAMIQSWITEGHRVALTCFELHPHECHRHCVAEAVEHLTSYSLRAEHL